MTDETTDAYYEPVCRKCSCPDLIIVSVCFDNADRKIMFGLECAECESFNTFSLACADEIRLTSA